MTWDDQAEATPASDTALPRLGSRPSSTPPSVPRLWRSDNDSYSILDRPAGARTVR
jgi:hypothetical protein